MFDFYSKELISSIFHCDLLHPNKDTITTNTTPSSTLNLCTYLQMASPTAPTTTPITAKKLTRL